MIQNHVTSLETSKRLEELGAPQKSEFYWAPGNLDWSGEDKIVERFHCFEKTSGKVAGVDCGYSAFLASELGEMLPKEENIVTMFFRNGRSQMCIGENEGESKWKSAGESIEGSNEVENRARLVIYLLENNLLTL